MGSMGEAEIEIPALFMVLIQAKACWDKKNVVPMTTETEDFYLRMSCSRLTKNSKIPKWWHELKDGHELDKGKG